jgi:apolipoprotein N-acyltransferase
MSRLRAVEHGRAVLVAATSGVSAVVDPDGTVRERAEVFTSEVMVEQVPLLTDLTPASRLGAVPEVVLSAIALLAVLAGLAVGPWRRRAHEDVATERRTAGEQRSPGGVRA